MNYLSLFSGIGGLDLGLDRAGMTCVGQVELDDTNRSVLDRHWPEVPKHDDVRTAVEWWAVRPRPAVRLVAGGFPCQPFSRAGLRLGVGDARWGWPWFRAVVRAVRPHFVLVENVAALLDDSGAFGRMLGDLAEDGFDAEWSVLSACAVGAPHTRERLFVVAYANGCDGEERLGAGPARRVARPVRRTREGVATSAQASAWRDRVDRAVASAPGDHRDADGIAPRMVAAGGNAVVPQVGEHIGRLILAADLAGVGS